MNTTTIENVLYVAVQWNQDPSIIEYMLTCQNDRCKTKMFNNSINLARLEVDAREDVNIILTAFHQCVNRTAQMSVTAAGVIAGDKGMYFLTI